jgi:hypothetical protein
MQAACNCTKGMHPFDFDTSSVAAQAHTSCNWRVGYYVRKTAPPLTPMSRLLDCGTGATTRGNPAHGPAVPTKRIGHGSVSRGRRRDGRYGQKWARSNGDSKRTEAAVKSSAGSRPLLEQQEALSHDVKTTRLCSAPRTARATAAPRTTRPIALTPWQARRHLWQAKRATLHLRHDDRVKKGAPHRLISYPFLFPFSLSCYRDRERGYSERDPSPRRKRAPSPLLIRGSKAGPSEGFDGRLRALGLRAHYWSEVRRLAPQKGSTAASEHSGSAPTTGQRFEGWPLGRVRQPPQATRAPRPLLIRGSKAGPPKGSTAASEHAERGMTLGTSDTWPRLGLRS